MKKILFCLLIFGVTSIVISGVISGSSKTFAQSLISNYLELNGGYVKAVNPNAFPPPAFTFEAWVKPNSVSGIWKILSIGNAAGDGLHYEVSINGGSLSLTYRHGVGGEVSITSGQVAGGAWNHIAVTIDGSKTKLFINGVKVIDPAITISTLKSIGPDIVLGGSYSEPIGNSAGFTGAIDEFRLSKTVRDVVALWSSGAYEGDLTGDSDTVLMWQMDEDRGETIVDDSTPNGIDGLMIGGDSKIHFFGVLPTPTPNSLPFPTLRWTRPVLPTYSFSFPSKPIPTSLPQPTASQPIPTQSLFPSRHLQPARSFTR